MKNLLAVVVAAILLALSFVGGCQYRKKTFKCPEAKSDTLYVYDTIIHNIPDTIPFYIVHKDTVIKTVVDYQDVDTMQILDDYFAIHFYTRNWYDIDTVLKDTLIAITLEDAISQNTPLGNDFSYKYYRPTTVINNVVNNVNYSSYLYGNINLPIPDTKYASVGLSYASGRTLIGVSYLPLTKNFSLTWGFKIASFKR